MAHTQTNRSKVIHDVFKLLKLNYRDFCKDKSDVEVQELAKLWLKYLKPFNSKQIFEGLDKCILKVKRFAPDISEFVEYVRPVSKVPAHQWYTIPQLELQEDPSLGLYRRAYSNRIYARDPRFKALIVENPIPIEIVEIVEKLPLPQTGDMGEQVRCWNELKKAWRDNTANI